MIDNHHLVYAGVILLFLLSARPSSRCRDTSSVRRRFAVAQGGMVSKAAKAAQSSRRGGRGRGSRFPPVRLRDNLSPLYEGTDGQDRGRRKQENRLRS
jgi:hypothetical protein